MIHDNVIIDCDATAPLRVDRVRITRAHLILKNVTGGIGPPYRLRVIKNRYGGDALLEQFPQMVFEEPCFDAPMGTFIVPDDKTLALLKLFYGSR